MRQMKLWLIVGLAVLAMPVFAQIQKPKLNEQND